MSTSAQPSQEPPSSTPDEGVRGELHGLPVGAAGEAPEPAPHRAAAALVFDDPLGGSSMDDSDLGWGDERTGGSGDADDLARFLREKPPHHL